MTIKKVLSIYFLCLTILVSILVLLVHDKEKAVEKMLSKLYPISKFDIEMTLSSTGYRKAHVCNFKNCSSIKIYFMNVVGKGGSFILFSNNEYELNKVIKFKGILVDSSRAKIAITKDLHKEISEATPTKLIEAMRITVLKSYWFDIILYLAFMFFVTFIGVFLSARSKKKR